MADSVVRNILALYLVAVTTKLEVDVDLILEPLHEVVDVVVVLQNLLEVANDPNEDLFTFITLLDRSDRLKEILDRTNPHAEDLNATGDRERIIIHRLFEESPEEVDESAVRSVVEQYVDTYDHLQAEFGWL